MSTPPASPQAPSGAAPAPATGDAATDTRLAVAGEVLPELPPKRNYRKLLLSVLGIVIVVALLQVGPLSHLRDEIDNVKLFVQGFGPFGPLVFILLTVVLTPAGVPRLAFFAAAGALFGVVIGLPVALVGTLIGAWVMFAASRHLGRNFGFANHKLARSRFGRLLAEPSSATIFAMRQMPVHGLLTNVVLGLSSCTHRQFMVGSIFGFIPQGTMAVLLGSGVGKDDPRMAGLQTGLAIVVLLVSAAITWRALQVRRAPESTSPAAGSDTRADG